MQHCRYHKSVIIFISFALGWLLFSFVFGFRVFLVFGFRRGLWGPKLETECKRNPSFWEQLGLSVRLAKEGSLRASGAALLAAGPQPKGRLGLVAKSPLVRDATPHNTALCSQASNQSELALRAGLLNQFRNPH